MKKYLAVLAGVGFVIMAAGAVYAAEGLSKNAAVDVGATVHAACRVDSVGAIAFSDVNAVDNAGGKEVTATDSQIFCTKGASVTVTDDTGLGVADYTMSDGGSNTLKYAVTYTTGLTGQGMGTNIGQAGAGNLNLKGQLAAKALDNVPAGSYTDTLTLTIAY